MANVYFFAELDKLQLQGASQAYGPVKNSEEIEFRTTSKFNISSDSLAFAAVNSVVLVQPQWDDQSGAFSTTRVNIVMKPLLPLTMAGSAVSYIIYRGIRRDSVFNGASFPGENNPNNTGLVKSVWEDFNAALSASITTGTAPNTNRVGVHFDSEFDTISLEEVFYKNKLDSVNNQPVQLTVVSGGASVGVFDSAFEIGIEVVVEDRFFDATLGYARSMENKIYAPAPGGSTPGNLGANPMRRREDILNFIDPITFYMSFYGGRVFFRETAGDPWDKAVGFDQIYNTIGLKFSTRNKVYIDVRNENGYSINYYKDYQGESFDSDFGRHLTVKYNSLASQKVNYYSFHWPILIKEIENTSGANSSTMLIGVRNQVNTHPTVYFDYGFQFTSGSTQFKIPAATNRFVDLDNDGTLTNFSKKVELRIPNIAGANKSCAVAVKLIIGRRKEPSSIPSSKFITKQHYLDNVFGPLESPPPLPIVANTTWKTSGGKKFLHIKDLGFQVVCKNTTIFSSNSVAFILSVIGWKKTGGVTALSSIGTGNGLGAEVNTSLKAAIEELFSKTVKISAVEIEESSANVTVFPRFYFENQFRLVPKPAFGFCMTRNEYDHFYLPAAASLDPWLHDIYINMTNFVAHAHDNGSYYETIVKSSGLTTAGDYQEIFSNIGNIRGISVDGMLVCTEDFGLIGGFDSTTDSNAYFSVDDFIRYVKVVENVYLSEDKDPNDDNHSVKRTTTRIRVHSYGRQRTSLSLLRPSAELGERALEAALPDAETKIGSMDRKLYWLTFNSDPVRRDAYNHLTARADENAFRDNPSPYLLINDPKVGNLDQVDMGQILYGFEALTTPRPTMTTIGFGYTAAGNGYPIEDPFDLAAVIANIATPIADVLYHRRFGIPDYYPPEVRPLSADINAYYAISAPFPDLIANADALGLLRAYVNLINNKDLKLSQVLSYYYKQTHSGLIKTNISSHDTFRQRWIGLALWFNLVLLEGNNYRWLPEASPTAYPIWSAIEMELINKMYNFAEFWYNAQRNKSKTASRIIFGFDFDILRFNSFLTQTEILEVYEDIHFVLHDIFFPYVKSKVQAENPGLLLP